MRYELSDYEWTAIEPTGREAGSQTGCMRLWMPVACLYGSALRPGTLMTIGSARSY
jgi:hypothetical protein